jgi:hypothetical protein
MEVNGKRHTLASFPQERTPININVETGLAPGPIRTFLGIRKFRSTGIRTSVHSARNLVTLQRKHHLEQTVTNSYITRASYV